MVIFLNFSPNSNQIHPLQVAICDSNLWLVMDDDENGKFRLERVNTYHRAIFQDGSFVKMH